MIDKLLKDLRSVDKNLPVYISAYYWSHPLNSVKIVDNSIVLLTNNQHTSVFDVRHLAQTLLNLDRTCSNLYMCEIILHHAFSSDLSKNIGHFTKYYKFVGITVLREVVLLYFNE